MRETGRKAQILSDKTVRHETSKSLTAYRRELWDNAVDDQALVIAEEEQQEDPETDA